jgi:flagellar protein FlaG
VIDKKNNKVIREFPPREALKLMEKMRELVGMLFDRKG